jgi:hypothetical protein
LVGVDTVAERGRAGAVTVEVPVLELDARAVRPLLPSRRAVDTMWPPTRGSRVVEAMGI